MNNASLLLNAARPTPSAPKPSTTPSPASSDETAPSASHGFDHAMSAARANASKPASSQHGHETKGASKTADKAPANKAPDAKAGGKKDAGKTADAQKDDDTAKDDDDKTTDDTSIAASMLALIGVPVQATQLAMKALGAAKDVATGNPAGALAALTGTGDAAAATKDAGLNAMGLATAAATDGTAAVATPVVAPFAALIAKEAGVADTGKDDKDGVDPASLGSMPFAHAQAAGQLDGPMQLQATQPVTSPQFSQDLGEQIAWMSSAAGNVKEARIKLHPEELGSMDVRVSMDGGKVNVAIMAQHPAAVHAVQQTLSNLDAMLAHHGLSLGQAEVNQGGAQQNQGGQGQGQGGSSPQADGAGDAMVSAATSRVSRGLVDEVA